VVEFIVTVYFVFVLIQYVQRMKIAKIWIVLPLI